MKTKKRVLSFEGVDPLKLFGTRESHLAMVEKKYPGTVVVRGEDIILKGDDRQIDRLTEFFGELIEIARNGRTINEQDFNYILNKKNGEDARNEYEDLEKEVLVSTKRGRQIKPRTPGQKRYIDAILGHDLTFGIGPAGTGKTYLAVACAVAALKARNVDRIFLVRPVVEAGESLGFLPGDFQAKLDPYVRPILDALHDMLGQDKTTKLMENGTIEIAVHNSGREIPAEDLDQLFRPFFTTKSTGLGMGLSISRTIVEAHGGRLWATSSRESGTEFHFTLPVADTGGQQ